MRGRTICRVLRRRWSVFQEWVWVGCLALAVVLLPGAPRAADPPPRVAVTIKPLHSLVAGVMAGAGRPDLIIENAGSPHVYSLRPSDAAALHAADLVFWIGPDLETFLIRTLKALPDRIRTVALSKAPGVTRLEARDGLEWSEGGDTKPHHHVYDPHIWLDPTNAKAMTAAIAGELSKADPANAPLYAKNSDLVVKRLDSLTQRLAKRLAPVSRRGFVVYHDAYAYFEKRFGLSAVAAITISEARAPGARHIARLRRLIAAKSVPCVFVEPQFEPRLARVITEATSARIAELDPLGAARPAGSDLYFDVLDKMADTMLACLNKP